MNKTISIEEMDAEQVLYMLRDFDEIAADRASEVVIDGREAYLTLHDRLLRRADTLIGRYIAQHGQIDLQDVV
jgi:hypothetical protein